MFSLLIVLFALVGFGLSLFLIVLLLVNPKNYQTLDNDAAIIIVKIVESCRESLPLNSSHGWCLTPCSGNLRCWKKELSFHLLGSPVTVYACSKEINCAAVILLNVIADVSTWSEWDVQVQDQTVHLELPENPSLHGDAYMQCDQLVLTSSMLKADPEVQMFRFGNLERNGTGWILLWNAKYLDWILYIAQPIDNNDEGDDDDDEENSDERCLLTAIWGLEMNHPQKYNIPELLCSKLLNISEAIHCSQLKLRPFQSLLNTSSMNAPHFPTIHTALNDLPQKPCVLLEYDKKEQSLSQNKVLAVKPVSAHKPLTSRNISGFSLTLCSLKKVSKSGSICDSAISEEKRKSRRRHKFRSDSISANFPRMKGLLCQNQNFIHPRDKLKQLDLENRRSSSLSTPVRKKPPELTVTQPDEDLKPPQRSSSHSFLGVFFQRRRSSDASKRSRSPSPTRNSCTDKRNKFSFQKTASMSSQEDDLSSSLSPYYANDLSDVSDVEKSYLKINDRAQSDYKSLGEYSISAVLQEKLKTSLLDVNASEEDQKKVSGGWIFKEMYKDISVFKKISYFDSCAVVSFLCKGCLSSPLQTVWKELCNPLTRLVYDHMKVKRITVLKEYPNGQKLIHMHNESLSFLKKDIQDFCLLQTEKVEGNQYILGFHSVKDNICPPSKDVTRGVIIASGWVLESSEDSSTQVSYLVQMLVNSQEISSVEDVGNTQCQCIHNLRVYLANKTAMFLSSSK